MKPTFKKGDKAYRISNWDSEGTWVFQLVEIAAWGNKRGTYTVKGENSRRAIFVEHTNVYPYGIHFFPTDINPEDVTKALAANHLKWEIEICTQRLGKEHCDHYDQDWYISRKEHFEKCVPAAIQI